MNKMDEVMLYNVNGGATVDEIVAEGLGAVCGYYARSLYEKAKQSVKNWWNGLFD